jgi:tRNA (guanine37-N1)-methyltransferase
VKIDVLSIFPDYLAPLELSLPGKARAKGLLDIEVHDLRAFTHDRHHTTDDTPYGGGAGMVMKPEPWGEAFEALVSTGSTTELSDTTIIFTTPSGERFDQRKAEELATRPRLVFACGRYEGIDQRVIEHAREIAHVEEISLGDYVLNGGEVAALAIIEAVVRLIPGFMGNAESLVEESHAAATGGLLEYPVYTKPPVWRGREVPAVLRSGDHAAIARWREEQARRRTAERRPDLLAPSALDDGTPIVRAVPADAPELLTLQRACWVQEALANPGVHIPALHESLDDVRRWLGEWDTYVVRRAGRLVAAVRGRLDPSDTAAWDIGRIMVAPDLQGQGVGRALLDHVQEVAPAAATSYVLFTGAGSERNLRMYKKAGFRLRKDLTPPPGAVVLTKPRHR